LKEKLESIQKRMNGTPKEDPTPLQETSEFTNLAIYMILTLHFTCMMKYAFYLSPNSSLLLEIRILFKYAFYLRENVLGFLQCTWRHHYTT
jgi:hypothetical protein